MKAAGLLHVLAAFLLAFLAGYAARQNWFMPNSAKSSTRSEHSIVCLEVSTKTGGLVWWMATCLRPGNVSTTCHVSFCSRGDYYICYGQIYELIHCRIQTKQRSCMFLLWKLYLLADWSAVQISWWYCSFFYFSELEKNQKGQWNNQKKLILRFTSEADVITYMRYGSFAASMTGNMVFAGREIALLQWEDNKKWQNRRFTLKISLWGCFYTNKYINIAILFNLDSVQSKE